MANEFEIECDESGFVLIVSTSDGESHRHALSNPEAFYDHVKAAILPWLMERDEALREYRAGMALARDAMADARDVFRCDPDESGGLDERWHSVRADLYDTYRPGK